MKYLILSTLISFSSFAAGQISQGSGYSPNDGKSSPGTFTSPGGMGAAAPATTTTGRSIQGTRTLGSADVPTSGTMQATPPASEMNTSPNPVPEAGSEANGAITGDSVYETGPYRNNEYRQPFERQAQEERRRDQNKTTPKK